MHELSLAAANVGFHAPHAAPVRGHKGHGLDLLSGHSKRARVVGVEEVADVYAHDVDAGVGGS